jgi:hypothetical protein
MRKFNAKQKKLLRRGREAERQRKNIMQRSKGAKPQRKMEEGRKLNTEITEGTQRITEQRRT